MKLNLGPGPNIGHFNRKEWEFLDFDSNRASKGLQIDFNKFSKIPRDSNFYSLVYGSHVLEHVSPYYIISFLKEIYRVMSPGAVFRIIIPDARKSIEKYLNNEPYKLFDRRKSRYQTLHPSLIPMTNFEAMKECFISKSLQSNLLEGKEYTPLAHQNAWDFESMQSDLRRAGFKKENIFRSSYKSSLTTGFEFESKYPSEAMEDYRSMYIEAIK